MSDRLTGGLGYEVDWDGDEVFGTVLEATRRGINEITERAADMARFDHPWDNRTGQTEASVFQQGAIVEFAPTRVWGEWGVRDFPRVEDSTFNPSEAYLSQFDASYGEGGRDLAHSKVLTTKDVALFLEFGTVKMEARPWLYPVWDQTKMGLADAIKRHYYEIAASGAPGARSAIGRFIAAGSGDVYGVSGDPDPGTPDA